MTNSTTTNIEINVIISEISNTLQSEGFIREVDMNKDLMENYFKCGWEMVYKSNPLSHKSTDKLFIVPQVYVQCGDIAVFNLIMDNLGYVPETVYGTVTGVFEADYSLEQSV